MKKLLLLFSSLFITLIASAANVPGHFFLDLSDMTLTEGAALPYLRENFAVDNLTEFRPVREYTDELGIKHASYRQYYSGVMVEDALIMVHSRDGVLTSINGCLLETYITPEASALQLRSQSDMGELMIVSKPTPDGIVYVPAYKTYDFARLADVYIDASTGEEIKVVSSVNNISASSYTLYDGWRTCEVLPYGGYYILADETRDILTFNATNADPNIFDAFTDSIDNHYYVGSEIKAKAQNVLNRYMASSQLIAFDTTTCSYSTLTSVTLSSIPNTGWYSSFFPDFYIRVLDSSGNVVGTSVTFSKSDLPATIDFSSLGILVSEGYYIQVIESNSASIGVTLRISSHLAGTFSWGNSSSNTRGSFTLTNAVTNLGTPAIQAHWGMKETYDFYSLIFNRKSYDDKGSIIYQFVNPKKEGPFASTDLPDGAMAFHTKLLSGDILYQFMLYGLGDGSIMGPVVALDVMAHEFTHLVTAYNGNGGLNYQGEPGALNESFSDIMGFSVENNVLGDEDYEIAEKVMLTVSNLRSMKYPKMSGFRACPDTYGGTYWMDPYNVTASNDNGGVHYNSGVQNKWFYLMNEGGSGTNDRGDIYSVRGIGIEKGRLIAYKNLMNYLIPSATYADARNGSLQAAADLFEKNSTEYQTVMNAWYAVGVGKAYDPSPVEEIAADESSASAYVSEGVIYVACPEASDIAIYAADGSLLHSAANATQTQFPAPAKGIYIVRAGDEVIKLGARD